MDREYILILIILIIIFSGGILWLSQKEKLSINDLLGAGKSEDIEKQERVDSSGGMENPEETEKAGETEPEENKKEVSENDRFRNLVINFVRETAENYFDEKATEYPQELEIEGNFEPYIYIYVEGEVKGKGGGEDNVLYRALEKAVHNALANSRDNNFSEEELKKARFLVKFFYPPEQFSFIEYEGEGRELIGDLVVVRNLDKELIRQKIAEGKEFLYRVAHKDKHGFYKKYDALNDSFEPRLHTVYSASIIYTFLYIYDWEKDEEILKHLSDWADFLLSMQNKNKESERYGAFHYSYYLDREEKENKFVVGTAALSIFTLLRLYDLTGAPEYLESARLAGNWLTTMQKKNGAMRAYVKYSNGEWIFEDKESLLYNGQVLSALSKLYRATGDKKYFEAAEKIAQWFSQKYKKEKGYIKGEYREKNPISNCWVVMSLMDFYKASKDEYYKEIIFPLSEEILKNQKSDETQPLYYGGWAGAYSSSGLGWITEVMAETYRFCREENRGDCEKYKTAVIKAIRWLLQSTYSKENSFFLPTPERAIGGVFWNIDNKYVRTDSVCHALNGYIRIFDYLEDGLLLSIKEEPLETILAEIKK